MNQEHIEQNIIARKRKARRRRSHLRRLQGAYDRMFKDFVNMYSEYIKLRQKKWFQFWK